MIRNFNHQKSIGILGANPDSQAFILEANKLGFETYILCPSKEDADLITGAKEVFIGNFNNQKIRDEFLMKSDILVYYDETLNSSEVADIQRTVIVPQGEDLLSFAQDRVLQKAYLESLSINIAPYRTIVKSEDIKEAIRSIGYPAVLRTNQINPESPIHSFFIYEEKDIEEAASLLKYGTCVLESWLVSEKELSISAVKTASGDLKLYPIVEREYRNNRLFNMFISGEIDKELEEEIYRVTRIILGSIDYQGLATIDFLVTPADALYIENIYPYPNLLSRYSEFFFSMSTTEAHLRAVTALPIPDELSMNHDTVFVPFYADQIEWVNDMVMIYPEWKFIFYPVTKKETLNPVEAIGHIMIKTNDIKSTQALLKHKDF